MHFSRSPFMALAVTAMIGQVAEPRHLPDRPHRLVAVHLGHHHVHQHDVDVRRLLQPGDAFPAALGVDHLHLAPLEERGQREDVADVVVHDQHRAAGQRRVGAVELLQHPPLRLRQVGGDPVEEQRGLVQQPLGRARVLDHHRLGQPPKLGLLPLGELLAGVDDGRQLAQADLTLDPGDELEAGHVRQAEVEHHAVERLALQRLERLLAGADRRGLRRRRRRSAPTMLCRCASSSSTTSSRLTGRSTNSCSVVERVGERLLGGRLGQEVDGAEPEAALPVLLDRDDVHRDVPGGRVVLQPVEDGPAVRVGQPEIEGDRGGLILPGQRRAPGRRAGATSPLKPRSRARSSRIWAKLGSSSAMRRIRSPVLDRCAGRRRPPARPPAPASPREAGRRGRPSAAVAASGRAARAVLVEPSAPRPAGWDR